MDDAKLTRGQYACGRTGAVRDSGNNQRHIGMRSVKKNEIKPWLVEEWCIPDPSAEFVANMEDVLDVYERPYNAENPVVCIDETNKQLIKQTVIPATPEHPERVDYEYERNGVADVFMIFEPLAGRRETLVSQTRNSVDFAHAVQFMTDGMYPDAPKITLVTDNLNTHTPASLYKAFPPDEARRIAAKIEWHYTPKHGSWLDMAEIEIGVMCRQALYMPFPDLESFANQISAWTKQRNLDSHSVNWQFTSKDARIRLKKLYPTL